MSCRQLAVALLRCGCAPRNRCGRKRQVCPFQWMPAPPTPVAGRNEPRWRIGSAVWLALLRKVRVSRAGSWNSARRHIVAQLVLREGDGKIGRGVAPAAALERQHLETRRRSVPGRAWRRSSRIRPAPHRPAASFFGHRVSSLSCRRPAGPALDADRRQIELLAVLGDVGRGSRSARRESRSASSRPCPGCRRRSDRRKSLRSCSAETSRRTSWRRRLSGRCLPCSKSAQDLSCWSAESRANVFPSNWSRAVCVDRLDGGAVEFGGRQPALIALRLLALLPGPCMYHCAALP